MRLAAIAAVLGSGCSFFGVSSVPTTPWLGDAPVKCNSYLLPGIDATVGAAGLGFVTAALLVPDHGDDLGLIVVGIPALVIGLVETGSAIRGFHRVHTCRAEHPETLRDEEPVVLPPVALGAQAPSLYCTRSSTGAQGGCSETRDGCERLRDIHARHHPMTACRPPVQVSCLGYRSTNGDGHVVCAPTMAACEAIRQGLEERGGVASVQTCSEMPALHESGR